MRRLTRFLACFLAAVLVISNLQYVGVKAVEVEEITEDAVGTEAPAEDAEDITQTFKFSELEKFKAFEGELSYEDDSEAGTTTIEYAGQYQSLFAKIPATVNVKNLKEIRFEVDTPEILGYKLYTNEKFETDKYTGYAAESYGSPTISVPDIQDKADLGYIAIMSLVDSGTFVVSKVTFVTAKPISKTYTATDLENTSDDGVTVTEKDGKLVIEYPAKWQYVYFALPKNVNGKTLEKVVFDVESVENLAFKVLTDDQKADPENQQPLAVGWDNPEVAVSVAEDPVTYVAIMSNDGKQTEGQKLRVILNGFSFTFTLDGTEDRYIEENVPSLYQVVEKDAGISMGVAVPVKALNEPERMKLVYKHYNSLTCENEMKPDTILGSAEPNVKNIEDVHLNFDKADTMMDAIAAANNAGIANIKVRGHVFVWHSQTPTWFFREGLKSDGAYVTPEEMNKRMEWYIKSVAEHFDAKYPGLIYAWDVVNEAANNGGGPRTNGDWYAVYKSLDFIPKAFEYADKYLAKDTILFYNDYNECTPTKRDQIVEFLTEIRKNISKDRKLGAGMQGHHDMATPTLEMIEAATRAYAGAADVVHVTELDVKSTMGYVDSPEARVIEYTQQGHRYKEIYNMIKRVNAETGNKVKNITIWGTDDRNSWLKTSNSVGGSADGKTSQFPLLFDEDLKVKPAYWAFVDQSKLLPFINAVNAMNTDDAKYASENVAKKTDGTAWYTFKTYWADGKLYFWVDDTVANKDVKVYTDIDADGTPEGPVAFENGVASVDVEGISVKQTYLFDIVVDGKAYNDTKGTYAETSKYYAKVTTKPLMKVIKGTACVDGNVADWADVPAVELSEKMDNPEATAEAKVCWDEENLYVLMNVKDANLDATGAEVHVKDSMEVFIDELNEKAVGFDDNDKQYRVNYLNEQTFNGATCVAANIDSAVGITDDGYVVEAAIKWTSLNAKQGELIGLDLLINDGKDGARIGTRNWYDTTGNGWQNPGVFGTAVLVDAFSTIDISSFKTSTESILGKTYDELVSSLDPFTFGEFLTTLKQNESYIIPGIESTNIHNEKACGTMVPQGVCVAKKYLLISAYDSCENVKENSSYKHDSVCNSVLYVMDAKTENYITTISINTKCHVGALAYNPDEEVVYIADSKKNVVWKLPYEQIQAKAESGMDSSSLKLEYGNIATGDNKPSFLTYYQKRIYVGQHVEDEDEEKEDNISSCIAVYKTDGTLLKNTIKIPYKSQGVAFVDWTDGNTYMLMSVSLGRKNKSELRVKRMKRGDDGSVQFDKDVRSMVYPNMSEDIDIQGDKLYSCYESAANFYRLGLDKKGKSKNVVDRIMVSSVGKTIFKTYKTPGSVGSWNVVVPEKASDAVQLTGNEEEAVASGTCGENLQYVLYGDGSLNITGSGDMSDYSQETAPWEEYKESITRLTVGAGVDSIGAFAFADCSNLTSFILSEFSSPDAIFTINDSAFVGCNSLIKISLADKEYNIAQNAFPMDVKGYVIESDAQAVEDYCTENDLEYHTHTYEMQETIAPDCGNGGYDLYVCECGSEEVRNVVSMNGEHTYELVVDTEATCAEQGVKGYRCTVCEAYYETYEESPEHTWVKSDSQISEEDECVYIVYSCSECDETKVEKFECEHEESAVLYTGDGEKAPTCTEPGIGHTECTKCQELIQTNVEVPADGHTGGKATCKNTAECTTCHEGYGDLDKNNHVGETEVKDAKEATCGEEGYTGDTYCKECGEKTAIGTKIDKSSEHTWDSGVVIREPTTTKKGKKTYTCTICKTIRVDEIAMKEPAQNPPTDQEPEKKPLPVGEKKVSDDGKATYKVTVSDATNGAVTYIAPTDKKLANVTIPDAVEIGGVTYKITEVEKKAFKKNKYIKSVTIGKNVKTIGKEAFNGCSKLESVKFGSDVTTIGDKAFYKCTALTKISLPSKVRTIGKSAFYGCKKATSITIGKKVVKIGSKAFYGCSKVKKLTIKATKLTTKKIGSKAFSKTPKSMTVKVPKKKLKSYKSILIKRGVNKEAKF